MEEIDIWRAAQQLIKMYGSEAGLAAAERADKAIDQGDPEGESNTQSGSRMREICTYGSVRGRSAMSVPTAIPNYFRDALWLTFEGQPLEDHSVYWRSILVTKRLLGVAINPHLLRDC